MCFSIGKQMTLGLSQLINTCGQFLNISLEFTEKQRMCSRRGITTVGAFHPSRLVLIPSPEGAAMLLSNQKFNSQVQYTNGTRCLAKEGCGLASLSSFTGKDSYLQGTHLSSWGSPQGKHTASLLSPSQE